MKKMTRVVYLALLMVGLCLRAVMPFVLYPLLAVGLYGGLQWLLPMSAVLAGACVLFGLVGTLVVVARTKLWAMPTRQSVRRRLEEDSGLPHQPLTALTDTPIDTSHMFIWRQHQRRMRASLASARYRLRMPSLDLGVLDPYGLRFFVAVLVLVALLVPQDKDESVASTAEVPVPLAELWLEPPAYLHHPPPPVLLTGNGRDRTRVVTVPDGSTLNVVQTPHRRQPVLWVNDEKQALRRNEAQQWQLAFVLHRKKNGEAVRIGFCNSGQEGGQACGSDESWLVQLVVDTPPEVYLSMPEAQASSLSLPYAAVDDDAVVRVRLALTLPKENDAHIARRHDLSALSSFVVSPESLFSQERAVAGAWQRDLSHHPFAGLSVAGVAFAVDSARAQSVSAPQTTIVPQRAFRNDIAKKIVTARKALFWTDGDLSVLRNEFETLAGTLTDKAKARLALERAIGAIPPNHDDVRGLLVSADFAWRAALLLEDPSGFDNALYQLQRALDDYAAAGEENREQAREQLAQALGAYNESKRQQDRSGGEGSDGLGELSESVDTQALQQALDRQEQQRREQQQQDYVRHLQQLMEQQEQLMGESGTGEQQEALAESWRAPPSASQSESLTDHIRGQQAMRDAGESLRRAEPEQAREQQGEALGALERLLESTMREMAQSAARGAARGTARSEQRDPLGRILLRDPHDPRVRVPKDGQKTPASRVADKLRDALRVPQLAPQTKDYLERLLEP